MKTAIIYPSFLREFIRIPQSKSHTIRALLFASQAQSPSVIHNYLLSPDTEAMIKACRMLGAAVLESPEKLVVTPHHHSIEGGLVDVGNSGQVLRFAGALAALSDKPFVFTGDESIQTRRVVSPLLEGLRALGVDATSIKNNGLAPISIRGPLSRGDICIQGEDSQPVSALLMALAFVQGASTVQVINPGETPWVALTLSWFDRLKIGYRHDHFNRYEIEGNSRYKGFEYTVGGDFSSAAFALVGALITQSEVTIGPLDMGDPQGDKALIPLLIEMGAQLEIDTERHTIRVLRGPPLQGLAIDVNAFIDALPILAVLGCFAKGEMRLTGGAIARKKESDRISAMALELKKMGADIQELPDGLHIRQSHLQGASLFSHYDHRVAMSLIIAALAAEGPSHIEGVECIAKSYPGFMQSVLPLPS